MEPTLEAKKPSASPNKIVIAVAALIVVIVIAVAAVVVLSKGKEDASPKIGYATEATVMLDQNSLQAAMDEAMKNAQDGYVGLRYKNNAYSEDGINFSCSITNSDSNIYDMFLTIYADAEMTDEIFLSGLVPPGSGFQKITLEHSLDTGTHTVYVVLTQVKDDENGDQILHNQVVHTMDFHVT